MAEIAEDRSGLNSGWHERSRAFWGEGSQPVGTLLVAMTCEQNGLIKGEANGFLDWFGAVPGPAQVVVVQEEPLAPCARVMVDQITRTDAQRDAILEDLARTFGRGSSAPGPSDWLFVGAHMMANWWSFVMVLIFRREETVFVDIALTLCNRPSRSFGASFASLSFHPWKPVLFSMPLISAFTLLDDSSTCKPIIALQRKGMNISSSTILHLRSKRSLNELM